MAVIDLIKSNSLAAALAASFVLALAFPGRADEDLRLPRVVVDAGGPYESRNLEVQTFYDRIQVPAEYLHHPMSMVCTNGSEKAPGFEWVRVFLVPDKTDQNFQVSAQPIGQMLVNEDSFQATSQIYLDLSNQIKPGATPICIEAAGKVGAVYSWEIRSIGKPQLFMPPTSSIVSGAWLFIRGFGFSLRADENTVQIGSTSLPVSESNAQYLRVFVPKGFPIGTYDLSVSIRNFQSRAVKLQVLPPKGKQGS